MKKHLNLANILVLILALIVIFQQCGKQKQETKETIKIEGKKYEVVKRVIDTIKVTKTQTLYKSGNDIYHDTTIFVDVPTLVDTLNILRNYYAKNIYSDTIHLEDSLGQVVILDTISQNKILSRKFQSSIDKTIISDKLIVKEIPKGALYIGTMGTFNRDNFIHSVSSGFIYKTKGNTLYQFMGGLANPSNAQLTPFFGAGIYWKISLRR